MESVMCSLYPHLVLFSFSRNVTKTCVDQATLRAEESG